MKLLNVGLIVMLYLFSLAVHAHEGRPVFVELNITDTLQIEMQWKVPPVMAQGEEPKITLHANSCVHASNSQKTQQALTGRQLFQCDPRPTELAVVIDYPGANPALSSLVLVRESGVLLRQIFSGPQEGTVDVLKTTGTIDLASQYIRGGVKHILAGWDHLLFVLCLLLLSRSLKGVLITVSGFTIGHSITLALSVLGVVWVPIVFIEMLIALSIVVLAAELLMGLRANTDLGEAWDSAVASGEKNRVIQSTANTLADASKVSFSWRYPALVAAGFGLLHGFGFASVLGELGLPDTQRVLALLFFNLGIELGQIAFILMAMCLALLLIKIDIVRNNQRHILHLVIYSIGLVASYWLFERLSLLL